MNMQSKPTWGGDAKDHPAPSLPGGGEMLPRERFGLDELLLWLEGVQRRN